MHRWPMKIFFYCVKPAEKQGTTPILDCRKTYQTIDHAIIKLMTEKKLMYVRNFIKGLDVSWQQFFLTTDKQRVEDYCRKASIDFEWKGEDYLTTRQVCQAVTKHPHTGEMLFFNQIQLHHISCLDPDVRASMLSMFREEDLPRNVYYGDGTRIEDSIVTEISEMYEQQAVRFQWQSGDVILLDNMMVAHARDPFEGTRKILVAMAEIVSAQDFS
jgi:alpha-ketoglutarate-dependent taurine dioxygenase